MSRYGRTSPGQPDPQPAPAHRPAWEPWEAKRLTPPPGLPPELREARADARLLLFVVRARFREGGAPFDLADRIAAVAQDARLTVRTQRVAATLLARLRVAAWERGALGE